MCSNEIYVKYLHLTYDYVDCNISRQVSILFMIEYVAQLGFDARIGYCLIGMFLCYCNQTNRLLDMHSHLKQLAYIKSNFNEITCKN